jgi:hypothetical protein
MLLYQGGDWGRQTREGSDYQVHTRGTSQDLPSLLMAHLLISVLAQSPERSVYRAYHLTGEDQRGKEHPQGCTVKIASLESAPGSLSSVSMCLPTLLCFFSH